MTRVLKELKWELVRMFARRRTYLGFGAFLLLDVLIVLIGRNKIQQYYERLIETNGFGFETYFSATTLGLLMLAVSYVLLCGLFVALVSGDIVAKEWEDGNLRMILCRPISRFRLLLLKYAACQIYTFVFMIFVGLAAFITGWLIRGWGGLFAIFPEQGTLAVFTPWQGLGRFWLGVLLLGVGMTTLSSVGFLFSCLRVKPVTASIMAIAFYFVDRILAVFPAFEDYRHFFLSTRIEKWLLAFVQQIPWPVLVEAYAVLFGVNVSAFILAWLMFQGRDLKS